MRLPIPVDKAIAQCVSNVATGILPQLQDANSNIRSLGFMFGHGAELIQTLAEMTKGKTQKYLKFPVIMLFADVPTSATSVKGLFGDVTLNMAIAMSTQPDYKAPTRAEKNFKPILRPIYKALINEIAGSGYFWVQSPRSILGNAIERYYWGKEGIYGNDSNKFNDYLDAIEIKNLRLTQTDKCREGIFIPGSEYDVPSDGPYTIFYKLEDIIAASKKIITLQAGVITATTMANDTITDPFFANPITEITTDGQDYIVGVDFAVNTLAATITGINITFIPGQTILVKR